MVEVEAPKMCTYSCRLLMEEVIKGPMTCPHAVSSHFASCSSAGDVVGGGCGATASLDTTKSPLYWKFALLRILREVPKSRRTRVRKCCRARGQEDEEEGRWEVLGRGGAQLLKHLGSGEVRFEHDVVDRQIRRRRLLLQQLVAEPWQGLHVVVVSA